MTGLQSLENAEQIDKPVRHIVALSGGKDSTALAVFLRKKFQILNMFFVTLAKNFKKLMTTSINFRIT